ncbi:MAG: 2-hydroxyglutaryl-CoA dehydratase [Firmicutes bacterium HGW-Firmicutes-14]|nr:MAG: 2-hydroxyglutaryl-CoA dehydratase [Firmicutes bacterium HGW-Firmicutes-14]
MSVKIGIPRALTYYAYYPVWKEFFEGLGMETVLSRPTTKKILDNGVKETVTDACVPIKLFHGHVLDLKDRVDYIFAPRFVSVNNEKTVTFCPKFLGLPNMIRSSISGLPPLIDIRIDLKKGRTELFKICYRLGRQFDADLLTIIKAYMRGLKAQARYQMLLNQQLTPVEVLNIMEGGEQPVQNTKESLKFAVLGFPYTVYDKFVNVDIINKLHKLGIRVLTAEMVPPKQLLSQAKKVPKNLFWNFSNQVLRAALYYLDNAKVDGIIHITAFGCGPDAMVDKMIELEAKQRGKIPFMSITVDEHTGEAGLMTRIEAFVDMMVLRRGLS